MVSNKKIAEFIIPTNNSYMGNITLNKSQYEFKNSEDILLINSLKNPISYSIAKDVFSVITNNYNYYNEW